VKRKDFLAYLVRAVKENFLTESEASALLRRFDSGDINESMLSLLLDEAITETTEDEISKAALVLVGLGILSKVSGQIRFPRLTESQQERTATRLQERFATQVRGFAYKSIEDLGGWQRSMSRTISEHIIQQSMLGRLRPLEQSEIKILDLVVKAQLTFAARFADEQSIRLLQGNPFSVDYIGARSEQYNGVARAEFYRAKEGELEDGYIVDFVAQDDNSTCIPCLDAQNASPYLPGEGEFPGLTCDGRGFCRCVREERYDPAVANELREGLRAA
jgi:hypothetical protein